MICESEYWKQGLLKQAAILRKLSVQKRWVPATYGRLEQTVMLGFYTIRKLSEAKLTSDATLGQEITVLTYPPTGKTVTRINWHKLDVLYDLEESKTVSVDVIFLCHQFVHSYIFIACMDEPFGLQGIMFSSDRKRHDFLYHIHIQTIIDLFEQVGSEYPDKVQMTYNVHRRDYDVTTETST